MEREQGGCEGSSPQLPFIPDEDEDALITAVSKAESVLLIGRSGTGKTSIAINPKPETRNPKPET